MSHIYTIMVKAVGYDTVEMSLPARSLTDARKQELEAVKSWLNANAIGENSRWLAFVETKRSK